MTPPARTLSALAVTLIGVAVGTGLVGGTAHAAPGRCPVGTGVTVVLDFTGLGDGTQIGCDPGGAGEAASQVVPRAGFEVTYAAGQPFVCRIAGRPDAASESCQQTPPGDAYWGIFWSDGRTRQWVYSQQGIASLDVPSGGSIGFRFQDGGGLEQPAAAPNVGAAPSPSPTVKPTRTPDPSPTPTRSPTPTSAPPSTPPSTPSTPSSPPTASRTASATGRPSATPDGRATRKPERTATAVPSTSDLRSPTPASTSVADPTQGGDLTLASGGQEEGGGGAGGALLPTLAVAAIVGLAGTAGYLGWRRRV